MLGESEQRKFQCREGARRSPPRRTARERERAESRVARVAMAVRRLRRTRTRRLVQLVKPRVTAIITKKGWEDILRKSKGRTLVVMFRGVSVQRESETELPRRARGAGMGSRPDLSSMAAPARRPRRPPLAAA